MPTDFDNLIRNAKPTVPEAARERVLGFIEAGGAAASSPAPFRLLSRVAALVLLAVASGIAAALVSQPEPVDVVVDFAAGRPDIDTLRTRVENLEVHNPAARLELLEQQVTELTVARDEAMRALVVEVVSTREQQRMDEWRERHIQYVREHNQRNADATIERLRSEINLGANQEAEIRALLTEAGKEAESLIGNFYGRGRHSTHREFEKLAQVTDEKLNALLSEQQRKQVGAGLVSAEPEDWGPSSEFRDGTDYEVYVNWMSVSRD